jgi:DNA-binding MarR family transcriptional regulator
VALVPPTAHVIRDNHESDIATADVVGGDVLRVRPGDHGDTDVDESLVTGESQPIHEAAGAALVGGSINSTGDRCCQRNHLAPVSFDMKKNPRVPTLEEATFLEMLRTSDLLSRPLAALLKAEDLSSTQYNVLRILRGAGEAIPCSEIANRMITRDPDITRLLDRLDARGLVERSRDPEDRRTVLARVTSEGLALLARLDEPIQNEHRRLLGHLGRERLLALTELLRLSRSRVA